MFYVEGSHLAVVLLKKLCVFLCDRDVEAIRLAAGGEQISMGVKDGAVYVRRRRVIETEG